METPLVLAERPIAGRVVMRAYFTISFCSQKILLHRKRKVTEVCMKTTAYRPHKTVCCLVIFILGAKRTKS
jgi:hypothetical protein